MFVEMQEQVKHNLKWKATNYDDVANWLNGLDIWTQ